MRYRYFLLVSACMTLIGLLSAMNCTYGQPPLGKEKFVRLEGMGLSNSTIKSVVQDSKGYLWVGTNDGLNRFDGYRFSVFRHMADDSTSLIKNNIQYIFEDSKGTLWVSTDNGGLHRYNRQLENFERFKEYSFDGEVDYITEDLNKNLWIAGIKSQKAFVAMFNAAQNSWVEYEFFSSKRPVKFFAQKGDDEFYFGIPDAGFFKWTRTGNVVHPYHADPSNNVSIVSDLFRNAVYDGNKFIWIATAKGLSRFDIQRQQFSNYADKAARSVGLVTNNILNLSLDANQLWIGTENEGLVRMDLKTETFKRFVADKNNLFAIPGNSIWTLYKDRQQRIWIGTYANGLCVLDKFRYKFSEVDIPLENEVVNAVWKDTHNRFWVATEGGIALKDKDQTQNLKITDKTHTSFPVLSAFEDGRGQMWFGTWGGGISRWEETSKRMRQYSTGAQPGSLSNANVFAINQLPGNGSMLVGTYGGLNILEDQQAGRFKTIRDEKYDFNNFIHSLYTDSAGNIWIGSIEELLVLDPFTKQFIRHHTQDTTQVTGSVNCFLEDDQKRLWVGTTNGLWMLKNEKVITRFSTADGLRNSVIQGIQQDRKGNLWLSTFNGVSMLDPDKKEVKNFDTNDGLLSNEFRRNVSFQDKDGFIFVGGKGVNFFHPDSIHANPFIPQVYLTDFKIFNQSVKVGALDSLFKTSISETREITLHESNNFFSIDFVALNFTNSIRNEYAYQLEGFNKEWVYCGNSRSATFTNLDPGTYTFRVKASNNDGVWNEEGAKLIITVLPYWWRTNWFKALLVIVLFSVILLYIRIRTRAIRKRNEELENTVRIRTTDLREANEELNARNEALEESKKQQLALLTQSILEKSEMIEAIQRELDLLKEQPNSEQAQVDRFNKILHSTILTNEDWENFKKAFDEVYPKFFATLRYRYPELTSAELRLCALVKLSLSLKEASNMLGVSPESIKQSRYRLKKKLNIGENQPLESFIKQV